MTTFFNSDSAPGAVLAEARALAAGLAPLRGFGVPSPSLGIIGQTYYDETDPLNFVQYGPKTVDGWGVGRNTLGNAGPADAFRANLVIFKGASITDGKSDYDGSTWFWTPGDYSATPADQIDVNIVEADSTALSVGAWVRQKSAGVIYRNPLGGVIRTVEEKLGDIGLTSADWPGIVGNGTTAVHGLIQALINAGNATILAGTYLLNGPINIPAGRTLSVQAGTVFRYTGADGTVFRLASGSHLVCTGAEGSSFTVRCDVDRPFVWAVGVPLSTSDWSAVGVKGYRCSHVQIAGDLGWADIVTPKMKASGDARPVNIGFNGLIVGGGATFDVAPGTTISGAAFLSFIYGLTVRNCVYIRCAHGIQWWGGNADINGDGAVGNERKCQQVLITGCEAYDCSGGGIWGSMGKDVMVLGCKSSRCGDLSFDAEGCVDTSFISCHGEDGANGNFNTYSYNAGILWESCVSVSTDMNKPVLNIYNNGQNQQNNDLTWIGGRMECTDTRGPALCSTNLGAARHFTVRGAKLANVIISCQGGQQGQATIADNTMVFPYAANVAFDAIAMTCLQSGFGQAMPQISNNRIFHEPFGGMQPAGTRGIYATGADPNLPVFFNIYGNQLYLPVPGGFAPITLRSAGAQATRFLVRGNMTDGPIQKQDVSGAAAGVYTIPAASNVNQLGADAPVVAI